MQITAMSGACLLGLYIFCGGGEEKTVHCSTAHTLSQVLHGQHFMSPRVLPLGPHALSWRQGAWTLGATSQPQTQVGGSEYLMTFSWELPGTETIQPPSAHHVLKEFLGLSQP
jgi:hypothetical protein